MSGRTISEYDSGDAPNIDSQSFDSYCDVTGIKISDEDRINLGELVGAYIKNYINYCMSARPKELSGSLIHIFKTVKSARDAICPDMKSNITDSGVFRYTGYSGIELSDKKRSAIAAINEIELSLSKPVYENGVLIRSARKLDRFDIYWKLDDIITEVKRIIPDHPFSSATNQDPFFNDLLRSVYGISKRLREKYRSDQFYNLLGLVCLIAIEHIKKTPFECTDAVKRCALYFYAAASERYVKDGVLDSEATSIGWAYFEKILSKGYSFEKDENFSITDIQYIRENMAEYIKDRLGDAMVRELHSAETGVPG